MPTLNDLARSHTSLGDADVEHLHSLVSDWQLLADLSFADLILWAPAKDGTGWLAIAQMRPTTGPTSLQDDVVGTFAGPEDQRLLDVARDERRIWRESDPDWTNGVPVRTEGIPVTRAHRVIAVIERCTNLNSARTPSRLELTYLQGADDLARMVAEGTYPFSGADAMLVRSPRVGDGLLRLGKSGKVIYASPNAQSAYRRLGLAADLIGAELSVVTAGLCASDEPLDESLMVVAAGRAPREAEVDGNGSVVQLRSIPLVVGGSRTGALILVRDVTELRRRERELMTKDATIREIHHRVKNNLQTVAALLRLQARRLRAPEARAALDEAVRRVGSIAVVHETLSHAPEEVVDFDDIADRVAMMAGEVSARRGPGDTEDHRVVRPAVRGRGHPARHGPDRTAAERAAARLLRSAGRPRAGTARGRGGARGRPADGDGGGQRRGPARGIRPGLDHQPRPADRPHAGGRGTRRAAADHAEAGRRHRGGGGSPRRPRAVRRPGPRGAYLIQVKHQAS